MNDSLQFRKRLYLILGLFVLLFILSLAWSLVNTDKTTVTIEVIPDDSKIMINKDEGGVGNQKLKPGTYTFTASKEGFKEDSYTVVVGEDPVKVILLPSPESEEANKWLTDNPEIDMQREALGGERANIKGFSFQDTNPVVKDLPYDTLEPVNGVLGPFSIDFGPSSDRLNGIELYVTSVSPKGRQNALVWLRSQGYEPTDYVINFSDYANPFIDYTDFSTVSEEQ